jgi:hypothetical protein
MRPDEQKAWREHVQKAQQITETRPAMGYHLPPIYPAIVAVDARLTALRGERDQIEAILDEAVTPTVSAEGAEWSLSERVASLARAATALADANVTMSAEAKTLRDERDRALAVARKAHDQTLAWEAERAAALRKRDAARAEADKYRLWWESSQDALRELMHDELPAARAEAKALREGLETIRDMGIGTVIEHQARAALRAASAEGQEVPNA